MPLEILPEISLQAGQPLQYYLVAFDKDGNELEDGKMSQELVKVVASEQITDVFIFSHGWMGDVPSARDQYKKWLTAIAKQNNDLKKMDEIRQGFKPLFIGIHWPSLPWGDENLANEESGEVTSESPISALIDSYEQIADSEEAKELLQTILSAAMDDLEPSELSPEVVEAYEKLNQLSGLGSEGEGAAPGNDRESFDPEEIYQAAREEFADEYAESVDFSTFSTLKSLVLKPLQLLSYWKMKERARKIGENSVSQLLRELQAATSENVRFHLKGHSFGCIVVSATIAGKGGKGELLRPVNSLALLQGAVSLWSYSSQSPYVPGNKSGYFHSIIADKRVDGPIVISRSEHDRAVGKLYPLAGKVAFSAVDFAPGKLPKYGGIGAFGAQGEGLDIVDLNMLDRDLDYSFESGKIYNIEGSKYICANKLVPGLGAHCDIYQPVVAHPVLQAALAS
ncbi:hypothetical protein ACP6PL_07355 [Dapis sp. BLCC M126]|uniref:hypothetical protein n=1 Tax=Dapis sp. BLCC M126 TaxID=3400189 RepID=UPI003CF54D9C